MRKKMIVAAAAWLLLATATLPLNAQVQTSTTAAPAVPGYSVPSGYTLVLNSQVAATSTNGAVPSPQTFVQSVESYFTVFNTNLTTFSTNQPYELWTGAAYQSGINLGAVVAAEAKPFAKFPGLMLGEATTFAGVVGTVAQEEIDLGWAIRHYDVEITLGGCGVDAFHNGNGGTTGLKGGVFAEVKKAATDNSFYGLRLNAIWGKGKGEQPPITFFAGFTF